MESFGMTDIGKVRSSNEDHFLIAELARTMKVHATSLPTEKELHSSHRGQVLLVADGMGGHQAGELASALTVISIEEFLLNSLKRFFQLESLGEQNVLKEFQNALLEADALIFKEASQHPELLGMGTTVTLAFVSNMKLFLAHVGDSRCYLYSEGMLQRLTKDHTVVEELLRRGALTPEDAASFKYRNVVTNYLGGPKAGAFVELHQLDLAPGDTILLCSDGLTGMVSDDSIASLLQQQPNLKLACEELTRLANEGGGKDNITVLLARF